MAREELTEVAVIMDESGSMQSTALDAIGGFNSFIATQKKLEGEANVTLVLFNNKYEIVYNGTPIDRIADLDSKTYNPGGGTALIDAMGKTIDSLSSRIVKMEEDEKPGKVIVIIITDGEENNSFEYKRSDVAKKVKECQDREDWEFVFIGASAEVLAQADDLGLRSDRTMSYTASVRGTRAAYDSLSASVSSYRSSGDFLVDEKVE